MDSMGRLQGSFTSATPRMASTRRLSQVQSSVAAKGPARPNAAGWARHPCPFLIRKEIMSAEGTHEEQGVPELGKVVPMGSKTYGL